MKIAEILNTGKKKILALTLVSALAVAGTGTVAMAAGVSLPDVFPFLNVKGAENASIVMSSEDGTRYSTNGGKTWSDTEPAGFVQEANTPDGNGVAVDAKIADDGTMLYSTDGGKNWSATAPDGVTVSAGVSSSEGIPLFNVKGAENAAIVMSSEKGTKYSTDGGKTWSDTEPAGFVQEANTPDGNGVAVDTKIADDGTMLYSTDGGKTWSETAPDGVTASISTPGK